MYHIWKCLNCSWQGASPAPPEYDGDRASCPDCEGVVTRYECEFPIKITIYNSKVTHGVVQPLTCPANRFIIVHGAIACFDCGQQLVAETVKVIEVEEA